MSWAWWHTPEISALRRLAAQEDGRVQRVYSKPGLYNKFQSTQSYRVRICLRRKYIYIYIHIHIHICICVYIYVYVCVYICDLANEFEN